MKKNTFILLLLNLLFIQISPILASIPSANILIFKDYSTAGYSIEKIPNTNNFILTGTLYKLPILDACSNSMDSADIHFLVVDENGSIITSKVFNSGSNDYSYDITTYDVNLNQYLLTTASIDVQSLCGPIASISYLVVDLSGNLLQKHTFETYDQPIISSGYYCNSIGIRDIRPFKTIVTENGITTVGMQKDFIGLAATPLSFNELIKTGFVKHMDFNFNPLWDKLILNNMPNLPCYMLPSGFIGNDFDILDNVIEIPGKGFFVSGSTTISKNNGSIFDEGVVALQLDYSGNIIHDWSHYSSNQPNVNLNSSDAIYSKNDKLIYLLENDESNSTVRVLAMDPFSNSYVNKYAMFNSNMDVRVMGYSLIEDVENPENLIISGLSDQISGGTSGFGLSPFIMVLNKSSVLSDIIWRHQTWVVDNSGYESRGDDVQKLNNSIPTIHTQRMMAQYDFLPDHKLMLVGYDWVATAGQFGLKLITFENAVNGNSVDNSCENFKYESQLIESDLKDFKVTEFSSTTKENEINFEEPLVGYEVYDCNQNVLSMKENSKVNYPISLLDQNKLLIGDLNEFEENISKIVIYDYNGQVVYTANQVNSSLIKNKMKSLTHGLYFMKIIYTSGGVNIRKYIN